MEAMPRVSLGWGVLVGWLPLVPSTGSFAGPHVLPHRARPPLRLHPHTGVNAAPLPHCLGCFIICRWGCNWPGAPRRGPHGCTSCSQAAPSIFPPCANTGHTQVGGTEDVLLPPQGQKKRRAAIPKVPHPWDGAERTLVPLQTACLSLLSTEGARSSGEGSGCP